MAPQALPALALLLCLYLSTTSAQWVTPAAPVPNAQAYVGTTPSAASLFVCRGTTATGDVPGMAVAASGGGAFAPGCAVAYNKNVVVVSPAQLLSTDARLGWWGGLPPGPPGAAFELAGVLSPSGEPQYVCRGRPASAGSAALAGTTNLVHQRYDQLGDVGPVCLVANGGLVSPTFVAGTVMEGLGTFEFLVRTPLGTTAAQYAAAGVVPATVFGPTPSGTPTPSNTPSATPPNSPSPSTTPSVLPYYTTLWYSPSEALTLTNLTTFYAGIEQDGINEIFVCAGFVDTADPNVRDILPGKYEVNFGKCNVPFNLTEFPDPQYLLLRASPWLMWSTAITPSRNATPASPFPFVAPFTGLTPVMEGGLRGIRHYVCRAWYTLPGGFWPYASGPHSGYTDALPAGAPVCKFSYGGGVISVPAFDLLWSAPAYMSPSDATNVSSRLPTVPKPGASASATPSFSRTRSPSPSPSPSPLTPGAVMWVTQPAGFRSVYAAPTRYVMAGVDFDGASPMGLCRSVVGEAAALAAARAAAGNASLLQPPPLPLPGSFQTLWDACKLPTAAPAPALSRTELLLAQPYISWASPPTIAAQLPDARLITYGGSSAAAPTGMPLTQSLEDFAASPTPLAICRAYHPATRAGPYSGLFNATALYNTAASAAGGQVVPCSSSSSSSSSCAPGCLLNAGMSTTGAASSLVLVTASYQLLYLLPARLTPAQAGNWSSGLTIPSPSTTLTASITPSPTMSPAVPGVLQWLRGPLAPWPDMFVGGIENGKLMYVCRAYNDTLKELMPGKTWSDVSYCNVALRGHEVVDQVYEVLRANPALAWVPRVENGTHGCGLGTGVLGVNVCSAARLVAPPRGSTPVIAGVVDDLPAQPCRAKHPGINQASPAAWHPGYTDGQVYNGIPLCFFSYGGGIVRTAPFDVLVVLPNVSPSATPSKPPSPSASPTGTPTPTPRSTPTASSTRTPTPTLQPSLSQGASPSNTPSTSLSSSASTTASSTPCPSASASPGTSAAAAGGDGSASASASVSAAVSASASASASVSFTPLAGAPPAGAQGSSQAPAAFGDSQIAALALGLVLLIALSIWRWHKRFRALLASLGLVSNAGGPKPNSVELKDEEDARAPVVAFSGKTTSAAAAAAASAAVVTRPASAVSSDSSSSSSSSSSSRSSASSASASSGDVGSSDDAWSSFGSGRLAPGVVAAPDESASGGQRKGGADPGLAEW